MRSKIFKKSPKKLQKLISKSIWLKTLIKKSCRIKMKLRLNWRHNWRRLKRDIGRRMSKRVTPTELWLLWSYSDLWKGSKGSLKLTKRSIIGIFTIKSSVNVLIRNGWKN